MIRNLFEGDDPKHLDGPQKTVLFLALPALLMQVPSAIHRKASSLVCHPSCFKGRFGKFQPWKEAKKTIGKQSEKEGLTAN